VLLLLGEQELAVADDVELTLAAARRRRLETARVQLGGETRRPLVVPASRGAVEDLDAHVAESIGLRSISRPAMSCRRSASLSEHE
jgi:hypothetical protein